MRLSSGSRRPRPTRETGPCAQRGSSSRSSRHMFAGDSRVSPRRYYAMGQRSSRKARLLAEWISGNGKINDRTDIRPNDCERWDPWGKLLLFPRLPRPKGTQEHLSHTFLSTRMPLPCISERNHPGHKTGPLGSSEFTHIPIRGLDRGSPLLLKAFVRHYRGCSGRVCR